MPQSDVAEFTCSACGRGFKWKPELAGKKAKCKCGSVITVPGAPGVARADGAAAAVPPVPGSAPRSSSRSAAASAAAPTRSMAAARAPAAAPPPPPPPPPPASGEPDPFAMMDNPDEYSFKDDPAPVQKQASAPVGTGMLACPSCGNTLSPSAKLCVNCGYNLATGEKLGTQVARTPKGAGGAAPTRARGKAGAVVGNKLEPGQLKAGASSLFFGTCAIILGILDYTGVIHMRRRRWTGIFDLISEDWGVLVGFSIVGVFLIGCGVLIFMGKLSWETDKE